MNPYESPTLTGFNSGPPSNDGSKVAANQVNWQTHLDKIGDPLKSYAEAIDAAALAAFGLVFGAAALAKSSNYTVTTSDRGRIIYGTSTLTITLLATALAGEGFPLMIANRGSGIVTVDGNAAENVLGSATVVLLPRDFIVITSTSTAWEGSGAYTLKGSFTPTHTGFSTDPTGDIAWVKRGTFVNVYVQFAAGTSNATNWQITNWPAEIQTDIATGVLVPCWGMRDNGTDTDVAGTFLIDDTAVVNIHPDVHSGLWTASGSRGFTSTLGVPPLQYSTVNL